MTLKLANETSVVYTKQIGSVILGVNVKTAISSPLKASQKSLKMLPPGTLLKIGNLNNEIIEVVGNINDPLSQAEFGDVLYVRFQDGALGIFLGHQIPRVGGDLLHAQRDYCRTEVS